MEWISKNDKMPEPDKLVLVCDTRLKVVCAYFNGIYWYSYDDYGVIDIPVTHWMPLPEPPKTDVE